MQLWKVVEVAGVGAVPLQAWRTMISPDNGEGSHPAGGTVRYGARPYSSIRCRPVRSGAVRGRTVQYGMVW